MHWILRLLDLRLRLEQLEDALHGADSLLIAAEKRRQRTDRRGNRDRVEEKLDERSWCQRALENQTAALPHHGDDAAERAKGDDTEENAADARPSDRRRYDIGEVSVVPSYLLFLAREALHDPDLAEGLLRRSHRLGDAVLDARARAPQHAAEEHRRADDDRHDGESRRRQARVRERQHHDAADEIQRLARELGELVAEHRLEERCIGRQPARQLTAPPVGEEAGRQLHEVREELLTQCGDDALSSRAEEVDLHEVENRLDGKEEQEPDRDPIELPAIRAHERRVEQMSDDERKDETDARARGEADRGEGERADVRPDARQQSRERLRRDQLAPWRHRVGGGDGGRRQRFAHDDTCRSTAIATKSRAR